MRKSIIMKYIILMFLMVFLAGCGSNEEISLAEVCESSGELCEKLVPDSSCKTLRRDVIVNSYLAREEKDKARKEQLEYKLLVNLEDFVKCSEKATFIEYDYNKFEREDRDNNRTTPLTEKEIEERKSFKANLKEREKKREQNYIFANYMLRGLSQRTKNSDNPYMLYWHWSRNGDENAIKKLEYLYEQNKVNSYRIHFYMSQYYSKFDKEKSVDLFFKALEMLPPEEYVDKESDDKKHDSSTDGMSVHFPIFRGLVTYYYNEKNYENAYIFAKLLERKNDQTANILEIIKFFESQQKEITEKAEDKIDLIDEALEEGKFKRNML